MLPTQDAARVRDEGEQALELAERVRVNAESQRAEAEGMLLVVQEKERQLAQVIPSLFFSFLFFFSLTGRHISHRDTRSFLGLSSGQTKILTGVI